MEYPILVEVLVADPPWKFNDKLPGPGRGASKHYNVLTIEDIKHFQLPIMKANSVLFLWRVGSMQQEALDVVRAWGFVPKTELVWRKQTINGNRHFGMGHYLRAEHEVCLVATRGSWKPLVRNVRSVFDAPVSRHSQKPNEFYRIVESLTTGPRVELFARQKREGWWCFGDEVE